MIKALLALLFVSTLLTSDGTTTIYWTYNGNNSTYRVYTARLAEIVYILEDGDDGYNDLDLTNNPQTSVVLWGDANNGDIHLKPIHPSCWQVAINTDYLLFNWIKRSVLPCYEVFLPYAPIDYTVEYP